MTRTAGPESAGFWIAPLVLLWADAFDDATRVATQVMDWGTRHGSLPAFAMAARLRAFAWWRRGALAEAEADATGALEHPVLPGFPPYDYGALAHVLLARGKPAEADEVLRQAPFQPGSRTTTAVSRRPPSPGDGRGSVPESAPRTTDRRAR
jgi:hypothetical protein